jgi:hypothetical protein
VSEARGQHPFQQWVDAARPREQLWRTLLGAFVAVVVWFVWTMALMFAAIASGLISADAFQSMFGMSEETLTYQQTVIVLLMALATIWGFALGVWAAVRLVHKRPLSSVIAWNRRFSRG